MIIKQHKELIKREKQLHEDMKKFILNILKDNNGRISYVSENTDDEGLSLDEKYPIISTLWGKHDTYNIAITDVYLKEYDLGQVEIYADGIDQNTETVKKGFPVYSEQFSDIIHFIAAALGWQCVEHDFDNSDVLPN